MEKKYNAYENALEVLRGAAEQAGYKHDEYVTLEYPERELKVSVPGAAFQSARPVQGRHPFP